VQVTCTEACGCTPGRETETPLGHLLTDLDGTGFSVAARAKTCGSFAGKEDERRQHADQSRERWDRHLGHPQTQCSGVPLPLLMASTNACPISHLDGGCSLCHSVSLRISKVG